MNKIKKMLACRKYHSLTTAMKINGLQWDTFRRGKRKTNEKEQLGVRDVITLSNYQVSSKTFF